MSCLQSGEIKKWSFHRREQRSVFGWGLTVRSHPLGKHASQVPGAPPSCQHPGSCPNSSLRGGRTPRAHTARQPSQLTSPKPKVPRGVSVSVWVPGAPCHNVLPQLELLGLGWGAPRPQTDAQARRCSPFFSRQPLPTPHHAARTPSCTCPWHELTCPFSPVPAWVAKISVGQRPAS